MLHYGIEMHSTDNMTGILRKIKRNIWVPTTVASVTEQLHPQMHKNRAVVILAKKSGRLMPVFLGRLEEEKTWSSASGSIMENDWTLRGRKDAVLREASELTKSSETSTLPLGEVSVTATCTSTISITILILLSRAGMSLHIKFTTFALVPNFRRS
jgi:hypothetical protein